MAVTRINREESNRHQRQTKMVTLTMTRTNKGRPNTYKKSYHPARLIELMSAGKLDAEVYKDFGISKSTFYKWMQEHPELKDAHEKGLAECETWWLENIFRKMITGEVDAKHAFNATKLIAANKFGYRDKEQTETKQINISTVNVLQTKSDGELLEYINNKLKELPIIEAKVIDNDESGTQE